MVAGAALGITTLVGGAAVAAPASPGTLKLVTGQADSGAHGVPLGWSYTAPAKASVTGTIRIVVPKGFSAPRTGALAAPGNVLTASTCARFSVSGTALQANGSTILSIATNCAAGKVGAILMTNVTVPGAVGVYEFPATFTPTGSSPVAFTGADTVQIKPGPLATLKISPATATITAGGSQAYTVAGYDAAGNALSSAALGKVTFGITPDGKCTGAVCTASKAGVHTVTAASGKIKATATLTVGGTTQTSADLAVTEIVSTATPTYYTSVSFTTTVTNTSATAAATGVVVQAAVPAGLVSPTATPSGSTTYNQASGTWTVGSLAAGASATLTISGLAGDVALGAQTANATVTSTTTDPNLTNNTASATETSKPASIAVTITPNPANPNPIDVGVPGTVSWTASAANAANPAAPAPTGTFRWSCIGANGEPCGIASFDGPTLSLSTTGLPISETTLYAIFTPDPANGNYVQDVASTASTFTPTYTPPPPTKSDLAVTVSVSSSSPAYYTDVTFTATVKNTSAVTATGVSASVDLPTGLVSPTVTPSSSTSFDQGTSTWTIGDLAPGASATLTVSALAGNVSAGEQAVNVTATATNASSAAYGAEAVETSAPAPVAVVISPDPNNPPSDNVDLGNPGNLSWTAFFANADNASAPAPTGVVVWTCETQGGSDCPFVPALNPTANLPVLTFKISTLGVIDIFTVTATFAPNGDSNYVQEAVSSSVTFTTTNNGG
ncbi:DUF11 domain-containing protein [Frankia sp. AgB1.9]|uniref:DUF11 domain-containing protein n=1 Tax=unclassified Frankia TaxID=2632575 RepID=UPI001931DCFA|nr:MULTISPECIES: DUF11 domain-containing protein [unclassified Frankia]MBL7487289.1 DUF11 domain-containing protein [Frankia sp. AgW1.1]MBL7546296.1 DUF11 domain-containing protein [Frankia sp. AgB1.9]MBL7618659.1 DUF11 domain-containing protein [Frankia sp. AgB1.8]